MRLTTLSCGLSFLLPVYARVISDPCATTTTLPVITVTKGPNGVNCQPLPIETAPPPGFTSAVVKCDKCGGSGTKVATLTFPTESVQPYSSSGYVIVPIAQPTQIPLGNSEQSHGSSVYENGSSGLDAGHALNNHGASLSTNTAPDSEDSTAQDSGSGSQESQSIPNNGGSANEGESSGTGAPGSRPLSETPTAGYHFAPSNSFPAGSDGQSSSSADTSSSDTAAAGNDASYPIPNQKSSNPYVGDTSGASSNGSGSPGSNSPSSQNDTPSTGKPATKDSGDDSLSPDSPITVSSAGHIKTNVVTCVLANIAGMFVLRLLV
ncbi:hypothetical protein J7337_004912 [Fusarium musae]|uniref:Uncharacterized protein n=1 Tax=Fusarium musae TaxID=1042133 RepID=A0A9P8DNU9_9HYPO|nr:hypothetical protein J7337_004912 [Fusarium musae]KAG9504931.1 hypothetical protein J7337_004912 [Fusarium musae]